MKSINDQNQKPEEQELENKKSELASRETDIIQRELDPVTLRAELTAIESRYLETVGLVLIRECRGNKARRLRNRWRLYG